MNLRQKAKKYKRMYEQLAAKPVQCKIVKTEYPIVHLRCCQIIPDYYSEFMDREMIDVTNRFFYKNFENQVIDFIKVVEEEDVMGGKRLTGDLWVVDRRLEHEDRC